MNAAVNRTRHDLRSARTAEHLLQFVRYPPSHAQNLAQSAEIFEQTMEALLADVNAGHSYNISGHTGDIRCRGADDDDVCRIVSISA